jgi:hypothetical protein
MCNTLLSNGRLVLDDLYLTLTKIHILHDFSDFT